MCRSEPHTPVASIRTIASSGSIRSGSGRSSTLTTPGSWKVTARIARAAYPTRGGRLHLAQGAGAGIEHEPVHVLTRRQLGRGAQPRQAGAQRVVEVGEAAQPPAGL